MVKLISSKLYLLLFVLCLILTACEDFPIDINHTPTFYNNLNFIEQMNYRSLIAKSLEQDKISFVKLSNFNCGGASGCYWHGEVLTKIAYRLGESEFIKLTSDMNNEERRNLHRLIQVGLEYGNFTIRPKDFSIEKEFPNLNKALKVD